MVGGIASGSMFDDYNPVVASHLTDPSPLAITAGYGLVGLDATVFVRIDVTDAVTTSNNIVHFVVTENNLHNQVNLAVESLADESFTLTTAGESVNINRSFTWDPAWDEQDISIIIFVQSHAGNKAVVQAGLAIPDYAATVVIDGEPDGLDAGWQLDGPNGYQRQGNGDLTAALWEAGEYSLTWSSIPGWSDPVPNPEVLTVVEDGTITFTGTYTDPPFALVTAGPLGDPGPGRGVGMVDYDDDGDLDIQVTNYNSANQLLRNDGGDVFVDVAAGLLADPGPNNATLWVDYDNDGDLDCYCSRDNVANVLIRNDGGGLFVNASTYGIDDSGPGAGISWADIDLDGLLDAYIVNHGAPNLLLRAMGEIAGQWYFVNNPGVTGVDVDGSNAAWADYDNDGDADFYLSVAWDDNYLFQNWYDAGQGFFDDTGTGSMANQYNGAGVAWCDYDDDGLVDLYLANDGNQDVLAKNYGGGFLVVMGGDLEDNGFGRGVVWGDFDNDMDQDLFVSRNGQPDLFLRNDGNHIFTRILLGWTEVEGSGCGAACGDYDGDGDLDLYVANDGETNVLLKNQMGSDNHWLHLNLEGTTSNASAIGAKVRLVGGYRTQYRHVACGEGYYSQNSPTVEFGLWWATTADTVEVTWPSGAKQYLTDVAADQVITIVEEDLTPVDDPVNLPANYRLYASYPNPFNPQTTIRFDLPEPAAVTVSIFDITGRLVRTIQQGESLAAGEHTVVWEGSDDHGQRVASGTYFCRLDAGDFRATERMMMVK